jgi:hypothetical protein
LRVRLHPTKDNMQSLRDAFRALRAAPLVSAVAVLSLALPGSVCGVFSIMNSLL